jgi:hypothetical protein
LTHQQIFFNAQPGLEVGWSGFELTQKTCQGLIRDQVGGKIITFW